MFYVNEDVAWINVNNMKVYDNNSGNNNILPNAVSLVYGLISISVKVKVWTLCLRNDLLYVDCRVGR